MKNAISYLIGYAYAETHPDLTQGDVTTALSWADKSTLPRPSLVEQYDFMYGCHDAIADRQGDADGVIQTGADQWCRFGHGRRWGHAAIREYQAMQRLCRKAASLIGFVAENTAAERSFTHGRVTLKDWCEAFDAMRGVWGPWVGAATQAAQPTPA